MNFIDFASEWLNSQRFLSCDRLHILVGIDGVCSELHVVDCSILVDIGDTGCDSPYRMLVSLAFSMEVFTNFFRLIFVICFIMLR